MIIYNKLSSSEFLDMMELLQLAVEIDPCYLGQKEKCDNCGSCVTD